MTESDELAARLRRLEDDRDIRQLIASYGPAVDAGDPDAAARLWASDGVYDVDGWRMEGRADIHAMVAPPPIRIWWPRDAATSSDPASLRSPATRRLRCANPWCSSATTVTSRVIACGGQPRTISC